MWECHVDDSSESRHDMVFGRDLFAYLVLDLKLSKFVITVGDGPYEGCTAPMIEMSACNYKPLNLTDHVTPE